MKFRDGADITLAGNNPFEAGDILHVHGDDHETVVIAIANETTLRTYPNRWYWRACAWLLRLVRKMRKGRVS